MAKSGAKSGMTAFKKKKDTIQELLSTGTLKSAWFANSHICIPSASSSKKTELPRFDAQKCLGKIKVGSSGKPSTRTLYISRPTFKKNPHFKGSTSPTGSGGHRTAQWKVLYTIERPPANAKGKKSKKPKFVPLTVDKIPGKMPIPW